MLLGSQLSWRPKPATILSGVSCRSSRISDEANFDEKAQEFLRECCEISNYQYHPTVDCTFTFSSYSEQSLMLSFRCHCKAQRWWWCWWWRWWWWRLLLIVIVTLGEVRTHCSQSSSLPLTSLSAQSIKRAGHWSFSSFQKQFFSSLPLWTGLS